MLDEYIEHIHALNFDGAFDLKQQEGCPLHVCATLVQPLRFVRELANKSGIC